MSATLLTLWLIWSLIVQTLCTHICEFIDYKVRWLILRRQQKLMGTFTCLYCSYTSVSKCMSNHTVLNPAFYNHASAKKCVLLNYGMECSD